jgi:hypothetical protein
VTNPPASASNLPLFYQRPEAVSEAAHGDLRLRPGTFEFAAAVNAVPVMTSEFAQASRVFPLVFAAIDGTPAALLGLERDNLFVADGQWAEGVYSPAYIRRYPFALMHTVQPDGFALAVDVASDRVARGGAEGEPLYADGKPTELTLRALQFCDAMRIEHAASQAFSEELKASEMLTDRKADINLPNGRKLSLTGFQVIDAERLAALADDKVVEWHRKGWLALAHAHLASLDRFTDLLQRQTAREPKPDDHAVTPATPDNETPPRVPTRGRASPKKDLKNA